MTGDRLRQSRQKAGWTQARLARSLGMSQAYLSLMESGKRHVSVRVARAVVRLLGLPVTALPLPDVDRGVTQSTVERELARLGYPPLAYRRSSGKRRNPTALLLGALARTDLDARLAEALPWLLLEFSGFDHDELVKNAKAWDLQNRLGFTVALAREVAAHNARYQSRSEELRELEGALEPSRLARDDYFGSHEMSPRLRAWVLANRSDAAKHWNMLTDLKAEHLPYAGRDPGALAQLPA